MRLSGITPRSHVIHEGWEKWENRLKVEWQRTDGNSGSVIKLKMLCPCGSSAISTAYQERGIGDRVIWTIRDRLNVVDPFFACIKCGRIFDRNSKSFEMVHRIENPIHESTIPGSGSVIITSESRELTVLRAEMVDTPNDSGVLVLFSIKGYDRHTIGFFESEEGIGGRSFISYHKIHLSFMLFPRAAERWFDEMVSGDDRAWSDFFSCDYQVSVRFSQIQESMNNTFTESEETEPTGVDIMWEKQGGYQFIHFFCPCGSLGSLNVEQSHEGIGGRMIWGLSRHRVSLECHLGCAKCGRIVKVNRVPRGRHPYTQNKEGGEIVAQIDPRFLGQV